MGEFIRSFDGIASEGHTTFGFEKDILTGQMLSALHPEDKIRIRGFEEIESKLNGSFDVVSSNIPFGDMAVFDPVFSKTDEPARKAARTSLHNYFFVKGVDMLREGGVLAFITSQGVMNAPTNEPVREWLMNHTRLVSAVRLPNPISLQKMRERKWAVTLSFCKSRAIRTKSDRRGTAFHQEREAP